MSAQAVVHATTITESAAKSYTELLVTQRQHILVITFNRPATRNALNRRAYYELIRALSYATYTDAITTVVLKGAADNFSAGNDLTQPRNYTDVQAFFQTANIVLRLLVKTFISCPKLLVAVVDGACIGIGFTLCALCDIVYCTERAYFEAPFTRLGLCPEACSSYVLPLLLGRSKASEMLLCSERLSAQEALNFNFVSRIVHTSDLETLLWPKLEAYSCLPSETLRISKRLLRYTERQQLLEAFERECKELSHLRQGKTHQAAIAAFLHGKQIKFDKSKL